MKPNRSTLFASFLAAYFLSQFFRSTNAVIAPALAREFALSASQLGFMTGLFYAAFAATQLPLGAALDRYGPRRVTPALMTAAAAGSLAFGAARDFATLALGRTLLGIGMAGVLMGALKAFRAWYPGRAYPAVSGLFVGIGALGALAAATPLAALAAAAGWRPVFVAAAALTGLAALSITLGTRDSPGRDTPEHNVPDRDAPDRERPDRGVPDRHASDRTAPRGVSPPRPAVDTPGPLTSLLTNNALWRMGVMHFFVAGMQFAVQGLWGGPYLYDVARLSPIAVGNTLLLLSGGVVAGYGSSGWVAQRFGLVRTVTWAMLAFAASHLVLSLRPPLPVIRTAYLAFGFSAGFGIMLLAHAGLAFPSHVGGQAMTFVNLLGIGGSFLFQWAIGVILTAHGADSGGHYAPAAYSTAFLLTGAGTAVAAIWYSRLRGGPYRA
ncbi:MAG: MFS transporter [Armatimonadota bacterium]|nr:MFS transporter [Armatimonadota bacterium]